MFYRTFLALVFAASTVQGEEISGSEFGFGNWKGAAYTFKGSDQFSHCAISASYVSGDHLYFTVNSDATVSVAVESRGLNLSPNEQFPVSLYVDRRRPFHGFATAINENFATLRVNDLEGALTAFKKGYYLKIISPKGEATYSLEGTFRALDLTAGCAAYHLNNLPTNVVEAAEPSPSVVDHAQLYQIATEMISELGVRDFRYLSSEERTPILGEHSVIWASDTFGVVGGVVAVSVDANESLQASDPSDFEFMTSDCTGDIGTTAKRTNVGEFEARELKAVCIDGDKSFETLVTKVRIKGIHLYTLLAFGSDSEIEDPNDRQAASSNAALMSASFVVAN